MSSPPWQQLQLQPGPRTVGDVKALLQAALSRDEWSKIAISEGPKGVVVMAPVGTLRRVCEVLKLDLPPEPNRDSAPAGNPPVPTLEGFEPPRATINAAGGFKLRQVVVEPTRRIQPRTSDPAAGR